MLKVKGVGTTMFGYKLFLKEEFEPNNIMSHKEDTASGSHVVWHNRIHTPYRTLLSGSHGWVTDAEKDALLIDYQNLGAVYDMTMSDDTIFKVRYAHELGISFTPIFEGACMYTAEINLAIVIV